MINASVILMAYSQPRAYHASAVELAVYCQLVAQNAEHRVETNLTANT